MKRCLMTLILIVTLLMSGLALAQITVNFMDRTTSCELVPADGNPLQWGHGTPLPGPYFKDLDVVEGDHHLRSVHDSAVILDGSTLTVTGSYLGAVSTNNQAAMLHMHASADLMVGFTPMEQSTVTLEANIPYGGEAWFFDLTDNDYTFDNQGPGVFTLDQSLTIGHEYLFQVFYSVAVNSEGPPGAEESVTMSMTVAPDPVPAAEVSWGSVKALFR